MGKIDELIKELCPDGVEFVKLGDVLDYEQPTKYLVKDTQYDDSYSTPVLTAGKGFLLGYTNESDGIYQASHENPTIIFDDFVTSFHWVDFPCKVKSSAIKFLRPKEKNYVSFRYIYYIMKCINFVAKDHARHWISVYSQFEIPLPPLSIQQQIVEILDTFTDSISNLQEELELREKQMEYYRESLLLFKDEKVEYAKLGIISNINRGIRVVKKDLADFGFYPVFQNSLTPLGYYNKTNCSANTTFIIMAGAAGEIGYTDKPIWAADDCFYIDTKENLHNKYIYYFLLKRQHYLKSKVRKASIPRLSREFVEKLQIPVPSLSRQQEIVDILDTFESMISNIKEEIELRQKQYEYYREKLLTFERKEA